LSEGERNAKRCHKHKKRVVIHNGGSTTKRKVIQTTERSLLYTLGEARYRREGKKREKKRTEKEQRWGVFPIKRSAAAHICVRKRNTVRKR
jgi:hypothetical protein